MLFSFCVCCQGVPAIKSGQMPVMYSANHGSAFLNKEFTLTTGYLDTLIGWSRNFKESCLVNKVHGVTGQNYKVVSRVLPSLVEAGLPLYPEYDDTEKNVLVPSNRFSLRTFASSDRVTRQVFTLGH